MKKKINVGGDDKVHIEININQDHDKGLCWDCGQKNKLLAADNTLNNNTFKNRGMVGEAFNFIREKKAYILIPTILMLLLFGMIIIAGSSGGAISPLIYALF